MKRALLSILGASACLSLAAAPVAATHTHVMLTGSGECVVMAQGSGEADVNLPAAVFEHNPNVSVAAASGRNHPLHVLVHKGVPGSHHAMEVYGTPAADALCDEGYVNR